MVSAATKRRNQQIISSIWTNGPQTSADLLTILQATYPAEAWTSDLLATYLSLGLNEGRLKLNGDLYQIRSDMVIVNYSNWIYEDLSTLIIPLYPTNVTIADTSSAVFTGSEC